LEFIPGREKVVTTTYLGQQTMKMEYIVRDAKRRSIRREKKFQLTRNHAKKVGNELKAGHTILELTRKGNDKDTEYEIKVIK
jgi:hypothetical protein